jgi:hypothetical protein
MKIAHRQLATHTIGILRITKQLESQPLPQEYDVTIEVNNVLCTIFSIKSKPQPKLKCGCVIQGGNNHETKKEKNGVSRYRHENNLY